MSLAIAVLYGFIGAVIRVLVSVLKNYANNKKIIWNMLLLYALTAILVGVVSGILIGFDKSLALLGGYAGLDLIDGYYKMFMKRKIKII